jgi:hypothetical protein
MDKRRANNSLEATGDAARISCQLLTKYTVPINELPAGGDRGCGAIWKRWSGSTGWEFAAKVNTPAPQLEVVMHKEELNDKSSKY